MAPVPFGNSARSNNGHDAEDKREDGTDKRAGVGRFIDDQSAPPWVRRIVMYSHLLADGVIEALPDITDVAVATEKVEIPTGVVLAFDHEGDLDESGGIDGGTRAVGEDAFELADLAGRDLEARDCGGLAPDFQPAEPRTHHRHASGYREEEGGTHWATFRPVPQTSAIWLR